MKPITIQDIKTFNHLGKLSVNQAQTRALFLASKANTKANVYYHTLYEYSNGHLKKHVDLKKGSAMAWLDETTVLIPYEKTKADAAKTKQGYTVMHAYDLDRQTFQASFIFPVAPTIYGRVGDQLVLSYKLSESETGLLEGKARKKTRTQLKKEALYEAIEEMPYYFNGAGFTTNKRTILALYDLPTKMLNPITSLDFSVENVALDPDKGIIYYSGKPHQALRAMKSNVYQYTLKTKSHQALDESLSYSIKALYVVNHTCVAAASDMNTYGMSENPDFFTVDAQGLHPLVTFKGSLSNTIGTDVRFLGSDKSVVFEDDLYVVTTEDDHSCLYRLNLKGDFERVETFHGSVDGLVFLDGTLLVIAMLGMRLQELWRKNPKGFVRVSSFNERYYTTHQVIEPEEVVVENESHTVKGWVLNPAPDSNEKLPAILDIHGGPKTVYGPVYYHEMQVWANEGYVVMYANPRGSDGKGNAFADIRGKYGTIDYDDLMAFVDKVVDTYNIDPDRLYLTGGSYGGFMTNWMVGHTNRFKAAVTQRSISNWISFYGTSDIGYFFAADQTDGHPLKDFDKLWEQSPLKYALNIKTPLLFIHADKDYRCPIEQAQQLHAVLMNEGVDTKLVWFKEETHELSRSGKPEARIRRLEEISAWFRRYA